MKTQLRMMHLALIVMLVFLTGSHPAAADVSQPKTALLKISPQTSVVGCSELTIAVRVENVVDLFAYSIQVSFTPGSLEILEVTNGGFLEDGFFGPLNGFDNALGTITFDMTQVSPAEPKDGSGDLIHIRLRALTTGVTIPFTINPSSQLVNWPDALPVEYTISNGSVITGNHCLNLPMIRK